MRTALDAYGGVHVTVRALEDRKGDEPLPAELVLRLEGASSEPAFHGFPEC